MAKRKPKGKNTGLKIAGAVVGLGVLGYAIYKLATNDKTPKADTNPTPPPTGGGNTAVAKTIAPGLTMYVKETPATKSFGGAKLRKDYKNADDFIKEEIGQIAGETTGKTYLQDGITFVEVKRGFWGTKYYVSYDFITNKKEAPATDNGTFNATWYAKELYKYGNTNGGLTEDEDAIIELGKSICKSKWSAVKQAYQDIYGYDLDVRINEWLSTSEKTQFFDNMPTNC